MGMIFDQAVENATGDYAKKIISLGDNLVGKKRVKNSLDVAKQEISKLKGDQLKAERAKKIE